MILPLAALIFWSNSSARDWRGACRRALAKVESLQIVTRHGYPYPLMQRFLAEAGPRGKIWGGLPGAATTPPDAVVLMEPFGRALPLYLQPTGARGRYRAAGATDPLGVDLPESRARAQVAQLPPPRFAGWEHADGLGPAENMWRGDQLVPAHSLTALEVRIEFQRLSPRMTVRLDVANTSATRCALEVPRGGRRVASVGFEPPAGTQAVPVPFVPASDRGVLTLVARLGDLSPPLIFFAVQIDDH